MSREIKRAMDMTAAAAALVLLSPLMALVAAGVWLSLGSPILWRQQRPGLHAQPFTLLKFRTMNEARDASGRLLREAARLTRFGKFLRALSLDELPQLWNVLRGEMSLVGPRPLLMQYLPHYSAQQARRHDVLPGLTGWAQINGRNATTWEQRFACDLWYVDHWSLSLDLKILLRTLLQVLTRQGVTPADAAVMPEFVPAATESSRESSVGESR